MTPMKWLGYCAVLAVSVVLATSVTSQEAKKPKPLTQAEMQYFESRVRPVLAENCFRCHGPKKQKGDLRVDSLAGMLEGGEQGPVVVPGHPEKSLFIKAIRHTDADLKMPPSQKLSKAQIDDLALWVKMGAPWPASDKTETVGKRPAEMKVTDKDRAHWAFQPIKRPDAPSVKNKGWVKNAIDAFVLARLEAKGLSQNPPTSKHELLRRVYYDLTGLPPTPREVEAFVADTSANAYEALVDRLLNSPRYGEKWGRHWLDLVRFAETNSYERDNPKPHIWRYRDYVIRAFNQDKPFDRFIKEQLAGDELPDRDNDSLIATGYYRLGIWDDEPVDGLAARYDGLDDILATTGQVFLGLTVDCARCHDHKIDPIPQKDYYRLLAFFHNINHYRNGGPTDEVILQGTKKEKALCVTEPGRNGPETFVLLRGNPHVKGAKVEPAFPLVLNGTTPVIPELPDGTKSSGRRLVLANWLTSKENQLTARVLANRVWQYHFGRGIVRSSNNFGVQGDRPTHPELLDWLATEFMAKGWRLKSLHRLIMTSNTYRMSSRGNAKALAADPANDLFWRFDMRRLSAEEIRDSILAVTGCLNVKMYGPGIFPEIPKEVLAGQSVPGRGWGKSPIEEQNRRSIYIHVKRSLLYPILESFDLAETDRSTPVRFSSTQPTQALAMLNGEMLNKQAQIFADRLLREAGKDTGKQVRLALYLATARPPSEADIRRGVNLIDALQREDGASADLARKYFCLMVLNLNEFVYLD